MAATPQTQAPAPGACPCGASTTGHAGVCGALPQKADVVVQNTSDGAVVHFKAKAPANVSEVQQDAATLGACMGGQQSCPGTKAR
ncbi:MAG: hypothetical protein JST54_20180 [Deltaproteobacteria bacterium]|nr:hypothetical protein [Deltaproteobacteria bacterium]